LFHYRGAEESKTGSDLNFMSIVTKTGDAGTTALMFNRRVSKCHPRMEACGATDELNSALGLARATASRAAVRDALGIIQRDLITLMGELATATEDLAKFTQSGFSLVGPELTQKLEEWVREVEAKNIRFEGWALPGANLHAAALDMARSICRRAERRVCALQGSGQLRNAEIIIYLNRLSDLLWLYGRWAEQAAETPAST
jgi:cob(I)alamin adenosyltransferase